jgi:hypothetical protein
MTSPSTDCCRDGVASENTSAPSEARIGPLAVKADAAHVCEFLNATSGGGDTGGLLPFTFPICWMAMPEIRAAVASLARADDGSALLPLHESQSFDYAEPLCAGVDYCMSVDIRREDAPLRLVLRADVGPSIDVVHLRMEMALRVVAAGGEDGQAAP